MSGHEPSKQAFRSRIRALGSKRPTGSGAMTKFILDSDEYSSAKTILAFYGVEPEPDTGFLLQRILSDGKRLCLPLCVSKTEMEARLVDSISSLLPGAYGIPEPRPSSRFVSPDELDLVVVPGLCFDLEGYRLGHGAGYYDRFLPQCSCNSIGLCFEDRLMERIPRDTNDYPVYAVATERRFILVK